MGAAITLVVMVSVGSVGWDAQGYWKASQAVHYGSDPYAEDLVALKEFHTRLASNPAEHPPFVYVYSPMTLPLLRLLAVFPRWLLALLYGLRSQPEPCFSSGRDSRWQTNANAAGWR